MLDRIRIFKADFCILAAVTMVILKKWRMTALSGLAYCIMSVPLEASFNSAFDRWFDTQYFPQIAMRMQAQWNAQETTRWSSWVPENMRSIVAQQSQPPTASDARERIRASNKPWFQDFGLIRIAIQRLGCSADAQECLFLGFLNRWLAAPWFRVDLENPSMLAGFSSKGVEE
eukprot:GEMP01031975.1.p1 GENE.GEMP01031975.1~~GEMP01031975.1.p1  ORF type:complete len:173 (+),score=40.63 GEMP01031975.1:86-604(+)